MKKVKIGVFAGITLLALFYWFDQAVTLNPFYFEGALFWCVLITAYFGAWALFKFGDILPKLTPENIRNFTFDATHKFSRPVKIFLLAPWIFLAGMILFSSVLFHWKAYRDQLGEPMVETFSSNIQMLDTNQIPIVDRDLALKLADKKLGERPSLGSQVILGEPTIQMVNGKLNWAVPLHHSGFFKWFTNMEGTPGYVRVSATNVNDVEYMDAHKIKYHPYSYFFHDLRRHLRIHGAAFDGLTDFSFEVDDQGQPYWIATSYKNLRGFALPEADGIYAVNATTGEVTHHGMDDIPDWVDRVQPEQFIYSQIANKGEFVHGFLNFSDKDKYKASRGHAIVYNNGQCYYFTGLTSVGQDESAIGFMMVDMVTKQPYYYQMNGATESAAQSSAQGKVQHLGYRASFPIILNIDGEATYFMTLKDAEGLIKQYALVSVSNYSNVGVGETIPQAMKDYETVLKNDGSHSMIPESTEKRTLKGEVLRIASEYNGNETVYKLLVSGAEGRIFIATANTSDELALTQVGDPITMEYYHVEDAPILSVLSFDNNAF